MKFLMTNDLEHFDISSGRMDDKVGDQINNNVLPRLLELYSKYNVKSTFFVLASYAKKFPESVRMIVKEGHEIGSHGFSHEVKHGFDIMSFEEQLRHLKASKKLLEKISGQSVTSFRSPALRINSDTAKALQLSEYTIDSSVCPRRLDSFFSYGTSTKLGWLKCPRVPYHIDNDDPFSSGFSSVLEIPISSALFGFIGSTMRASPTIFRILTKIVKAHSKKTNAPIVFLFHPNELLPHFQTRIYRRSSSFFGFLFKDYLRAKIKSRNLGYDCFKLLENLIKSFNSSGAEFVTIKSYNQEFQSKNLLEHNYG
jgi:peptidoglycan/xylan/chitin deacetylase (PgdA/CDA1 family)